MTSMENYLRFRTEARALLKDDEDHSIWAQIVSLFWRDAQFRTFNEARRSATPAKPNAAIASLLASFIDEAYVEREISAIGRLTDPPASDTGRAVVSLPTVLALIRDACVDITRENFVTFDGAPYDPVQDADAARASIRPGVRWVARQPWDDAEDRHRLFDRLSRKDPTHRTPADRIHRKVLAACEQRLQLPQIVKFRKYRNKVVSHAATKSSRSGLEQLGISLADVDIAHRAILEVAETVATIATGEILIGSPVAIPQYNALEHLELPFVHDADLERLRNHWDGFTNERERWSRDAVKAVLGR